MTESGGSAAAAKAASNIDAEFAIGLARAFGGAIFFAIPLLMTMEMRSLGHTIAPIRLALLIALMFPMLVALDYYSGFKASSTWGEDAVDALTGYAVGFAAAASILLVFNVIDFSTPVNEVIGKIAIQAVPASFGAILAGSLLSGTDDGETVEKQEEHQHEAGYAAEILFMVAGSVFLAFNLAPTEEMITLAVMMSAWRIIALAVLSILMMHAFVFAVNFRGSHNGSEETPAWSLFLRFTIVGYALALLVSAYILWTFGRFDDSAIPAAVEMTVVLAFPASLGAAAARLIL